MSEGSFPLTGVAGLPHVSVAYDGERWSDRVASGDVVPGEAVVPAGSATVQGKAMLRKAIESDAITRMAIALRTIDVPDQNTGPNALGPNEVRNQTIASGDYILAYYGGAFNLTLVDPRRTYVPGDGVGWDADGERPEGVTGEGSWAPNANADIEDFFEVIEVTKVGSEGEVVLRVRTLRTQH